MPKKRDTSPPKPHILGTGGARKAANALVGRRARIQAELDKALGKRK